MVFSLPSGGSLRERGVRGEEQPGKEVDLSMKRLHEVFVLSVLGLLLFASQGSGQSGLVPYTPTSPWNTPIPANPFVSPKSSGYISGLTGSFGSDPTQYSFPVYKVDSATPLRTVSISGSFKTWGCNTCQATVQSGGTVRVPIPSGAQAAAGTDGQIILWNASTGDEWEFWQLTSTYTATNGYHYNTKWSAVPASPGPRGAGIPYLAGLVRPWEIALGHIDHALALTYQNTATTYTFPATKTDGPCTSSTCMPEGSRLQLDPTLDVTTLGLSASGVIIAKALQKYGMIIVDTGGHPKVYFEYDGTAHWNGAITASTVSGIPLDRFRVLDPAHPMGSSGGTAPVVSLSPTSFVFGNQTVGTTSAAQFSTLTNSGSATLTISSVTVSGDFALAGLGACGTSLATGTRCTISVNFKPTATGTRTGTVTVTDTATGSPQKISLTGSGVSSGTSTPVASLSPTSLAFGNQTVGTTSAAKVVTLSNTGSAALSITSIAVAGTNVGDFTQTHTCLSSLAAGARCTISVTFKPAATGTRSARVSVTDNASGSPQAVVLSGSGVSSSTTGPAVSLSPTSLAFGNQTVGTTSAVKYATLTNTGHATLTFSGSFAISGDFHFTGLGTCGSSVAAGASCLVNVKFTPTATGIRTGTVTLNDNAPNTPQRISLSGSGVSTSTTGPAVSLSPSSLSFGNQAVRTTSAVHFVTLTNTGHATLTFSGSFLISGDFAFGGLGTCGSSVAAGASCTVSVKFTPTATGTRTGAVTLNDNAPNTPQKITLSGAGT
ncbi:MAG: hypothetical protein DMG25_11625 [Acidobacteria bacterium]|nr:MAG: hypothetical protein DMG25_11625 [Acidobacteriota bacterium]